MVSVIIPAYNCSQYVSRAIDSVLEQNVNLEIIVIDDCSDDDVDLVLSRYSDFDNIVYIKNTSNLGVAEARNKGVTLSKGEYIAFLDGDDIWAPDKLQKQLEAMASGDYALCATARELIDVNGHSLNRIIPVKNTLTYNELLKHNSINCSSVLMKSDIAREFPMHDDDCHEDYIMWLEVLRKYGMAVGINEPLLKYRVSDNGKSGNKLKSAIMTFKVYRRIGLSLPKSILCFISYTFNGFKKYFG